VATLTTVDAATRLGVTPRRVLAMIKAGRLKARRLGPIWTIDERALGAVLNRKPGRPRRSSAAG
jgi:excisionase family DNA binding protein